LLSKESDYFTVMKTFVYLVFTCFISTGAFMGALYSKTPMMLYAVGFGIWALFIWGVYRRMKKNDERRDMERHFQDYMRYQTRKPTR
jgi:protein-S-isoprenylcysteine O-methyltransferase Ste14